jgi:hypothetical protein
LRRLLSLGGFAVARHDDEYERDMLYTANGCRAMPLAPNTRR